MAFQVYITELEQSKVTFQLCSIVFKKLILLYAFLLIILLLFFIILAGICPLRTTLANPAQSPQSLKTC